MTTEELEISISNLVSCYLVRNYWDKIMNGDIDPDVTVSTEEGHFLLRIKMRPCKLFGWQTSNTVIPFNEVSAVYILKQVEYAIDFSFGPTLFDDFI